MSTVVHVLRAPSLGACTLGQRAFTGFQVPFRFPMASTSSPFCFTRALVHYCAIMLQPPPHISQFGIIIFCIFLKKQSEAWKSGYEFQHKHKMAPERNCPSKHAPSTPDTIEEQFPFIFPENIRGKIGLFFSPCVPLPCKNDCPGQVLLSSTNHRSEPGSLKLGLLSMVSSQQHLQKTWLKREKPGEAACLLKTLHGQRGTFLWGCHIRNFGWTWLTLAVSDVEDCSTWNCRQILLLN